VNFLADEGIDRQIVARLRQEGHRVLYVAEMEPGLSDESVLDVANRERALLLTADKDFGEIVFRQRVYPHGIVLVRLAGLSPDRKAVVVASAIHQHAAELQHAFNGMAPGVCRIRRLGGVTPEEIRP
jgi:predicted nuclease of predicted toxin-antitoxin system